MPETRDPRPPRARRDDGPLWARATRTFYAESFDIRSKQQFVEAMQDFVELSAAEQSFHLAHLAFRQIQALEDVNAKLGRLEALVLALDAGTLAALKHLGPMRKSLQELSEGQEDLVELMEELGDAEPASREDDAPEDEPLEDDELPPEPGEPARPALAEPELLLRDPPPTDPRPADEWPPRAA